jgi:hypothetical protein
VVTEHVAEIEALATTGVQMAVLRLVISRRVISASQASAASPLGLSIETADQLERESGTLLGGKTQDPGEHVRGGHQ